MLTFFEQVYGEKYSGVFLDTMCAYLEGRSEHFFDAAARVLVTRFPRTFRQVPGPAEFEKYAAEISAALPKRNILPAPFPPITEKDREEIGIMIAEWKQKQRKKPGPMTPALLKIIQAAEERNARE
jgi:hypothetical protein